jgi:hypothetical protein
VKHVLTVLVAASLVVASPALADHPRAGDDQRVVQWATGLLNISVNGYATYAADCRTAKLPWRCPTRLRWKDEVGVRQTCWINVVAYRRTWGLEDPRGCLPQ